MPMKGRFPIRRTLQYLSQGDVVFKDSVKVMTVNYNTHGELGEGARGAVCVGGAFFCCPSRSYSLRWLWTMGSGRPGLDALHLISARCSFLYDPTGVVTAAGIYRILCSALCCRLQVNLIMIEAQCSRP
ncbi:hypothetical protein FD754_009642 [Muntiacus muntjak]|uniref:Mitochondrial ribosomal protein S25 n=1 Tax=Muntiacus muntjak TaxID=9888 RepID=A0A5N3WZ54_MUNMU|nr:hypothetical protein FD754_009642 [Muntiacus muntjak]